MKPLSNHHVYFGSLSGKDHPFNGEKTFSLETGERYRWISYSCLITRETRFAWIPIDVDEIEAIKEIKRIQYESDTRDRFGVRF